MPTVEIPDSVLLGNTETKTIKLSGGRTVVIRAGTGVDMMRAQKEAGENASSTQQLYATIARCISINGKPVKAADIAHLKLGAIKRIVEEFNKLNEDTPDLEPDDEDGLENPTEPSV
jgi:hypothetical protein